MKNSIKEANNAYPILDIIKSRWSPRSFSEKAIQKNILYSLLEAARWSPSAFNEQPWRFIMGVKNEDDNFLKIFESLVEFNKSWAKSAPVLIVCSCIKNFAQNNKPNVYSAYDTGQSIAYLTLQALSENIFVHQMAGFDKSILKRNFNISEEVDILSVIALGYLGLPDDLSDELKKLETTERQRKNINNLLL